MKYLVNRETKEHVIPEPWHILTDLKPEWRVVEADADGWIKWHGDTEWPLPDNCSVELVSSTGFKHSGAACGFCWNAVRRYRPILDKPEAEKRLYCPDFDTAAQNPMPAPEVRLPTLLDRLKSAHEAAQRIPDLEAELREVLGAMGYDLVARNPFVERTDSEIDVAEPESGTETPQDMSDWRNWKPGDLVECIESYENQYTAGKHYKIKKMRGKRVVTELDDEGSKKNGWGACNFRFHSRPEVKS